MKKRHSMPTGPKRRNTLKVAHRRGSATAGVNKKIALLARERDDALEQQMATSEILRVIGNSRGELEPVFGAMLENATRLCDAKFGVLWLYDGDVFRLGARHGVPTAFAEFLDQRGSFHAPPGSPLDRILRSKGVAQTADESSEPMPGAPAKYGGARSLIAVPMRKSDELMGAFVIYRQEIKPFTDKQVALLTSFAAQAVIAIENARLLDELRESLQQQTATADVLKVISSSPGELEPVFQTMLENATRICEARYGTMWLREGDAFRAASLHGPLPSEYIDLLRSGTLFHPSPDTPTGRVAQTRQPVQVPDLSKTRAYLDREPVLVAAVEVAGIRTMFSVPMLKENELVGTISIYRQEKLPFTDKQIELVSNFAAQAVIAIDNTRLLKELRQRTDDLSESLEQQTATADVLKVISSSPGELEPVFQTMLKNAVRICEAKFGTMYRYDSGAFHMVAVLNAPPALAEYLRQRGSFQPAAGTPLDRLLRTRDAIYTADDSAAETPSPSALLAGAKSHIAVPMFKDDELAGAIVIYRQEVRPFADKQVELVQNFAAQAVIAIENTRLLNELRESLQQQTATADVLKVISRSTFDLQVVLNTLTESAARLCRAERSAIRLLKDDLYLYAASYGFLPEHEERMQREPLKLGRGSIVGRVAHEGKSVHIIDGQLDPDPEVAKRSRSGNVRTLLGVPLQREGMPIGVLLLQRSIVQPFTDKEIALAETFADQAVIAIENVRLFDDVQKRTQELSESLEQQTATSEVLSVISSSPGDLQTVFEAMLANATRICEAKFGIMFLYENGVFRPAAELGVPAALSDFMRLRGSFQAPPGGALDIVVRTKCPVHTADASKEAAWANPPPPAKYGGARAYIIVPMLKENELIGSINIYRQEVQPFTDKQIALVTSFASQAVIAIENTRLLNELRQSLQQQTATSDVLKVISRSTFDLQSVLDTLVQSAARLCEADNATITREKNGAFYRAEAYGFSREFMDYVQDIPIKAERGSASGRSLLEGRVVHIPDVKADPEYTWVEAQRLGDFRTILAVPMLREGVPIGVLTLSRSDVRPFTDKQIELVTTFADQAAIAIENVRLFDEIQDKSQQLAEASKHKSQFLANMSHELRTPLNAILGYTELILEKIYGDTPDKMRSVLQRIESNGRHLLGLINDVLDLSKIEAGQLTLSLSDYSLKNVIQTVFSAIEPLATEKKIELKIDVPANLPPGRGDERRLTQVLLNLVGNAIKFTDVGEVLIRGSSANGSFNVAVRDTGPGISQADQAKLFEEFQQADNSITKQKGGTGLGLAISKRIIELHGGRIWLESDLGHGSTFAFTLPVTVEKQARPA